MAEPDASTPVSVDETARHWSLVTKTRKGVLSILRDLTLSECRHIYDRLSPKYGVTQVWYEAKDPAETDSGCGGYSSWSSGGFASTDDKIEIREVIGPPGWDSSEVESWDAWPRHEYIAWSDPRHQRHRHGCGQLAPDEEVADARKSRGFPYRWKMWP